MSTNKGDQTSNSSADPPTHEGRAGTPGPTTPELQEQIEDEIEVGPLCKWVPHANKDEPGKGKRHGQPGQRP